MTFSRQFIVRRNTRYTDIRVHVDLKRVCVIISLNVKNNNYKVYQEKDCTMRCVLLMVDISNYFVRSL